MPYLLFLRMQQNLKLSSAANYRWRFMGLTVQIVLGALKKRCYICTQAIYYTNVAREELSTVNYSFEYRMRGSRNFCQGVQARLPENSSDILFLFFPLWIRACQVILPILAFPMKGLNLDKFSDKWVTL